MVVVMVVGPTWWPLLGYGVSRSLRDPWGTIRVASDWLILGHEQLRAKLSKNLEMYVVALQPKAGTMYSGLIGGLVKCILEAFLNCTRFWPKKWPIETGFGYCPLLFVVTKNGIPKFDIYAHIPYTYGGMDVMEPLKRTLVES